MTDTIIACPKCRHEFPLTESLAAPLLAENFHLPSRTKVDHQLIIGATVFGIGWGLAGFCPGPAVVSLALLAKGTIVFAVAMIAGILLGRTQRHAERHIAPSTEPAA